MKHIRNILFTALATVFLGSCLSDEETINVYSDVYVFKRTINDTMRYATTHFTYANVALESVIAESNAGETVSLISHEGSSYYMAYIPEEDEYSTELPEETEFSYTVTTQSGEVIEDYDQLTYDDMDLPAVSSAGYDESTNLIEVAWTSVNGADGYVVVFYNSSGEALTGGFSYTEDDTECEIDVSTISWEITPDSGEECYVEVQAYAYESGSDDTYQAYNIQEVSIAQKAFIWQ